MLGEPTLRVSLQRLLSKHFHHLKTHEKPKTLGESEYPTSQETVGVIPKIRGTPKWMVYNGKLMKPDDLGVPTILGNPHLGPGFSEDVWCPDFYVGVDVFT